MSTKKTLGTIGFFVICAIASIAVWKDPAQTANVIWPLVVLTSALFGIKTAGGAYIQRGKQVGGK